MNLYRLAAGLCLSLLFFSPLAAQEKISLPEKPEAAVAKADASAKAKAEQGGEQKAKDALDALPDWEKRYVRETRVTIENNISSLMEGIHSRKDLVASIGTFCRTWEKWSESKLFVLDDDRDIDVYGNLYSLQVMCRTLRLAASDWNATEPGKDSAAALEKAEWLEQRSRRLAEPVAEIIRHQSYSSYLPRRIEIMQEMLPYVDICYQQKGFGERMKKAQ
jgi:hypothetical protein